MVGLCRLCASLRKVDVLVTINNDSNDICEKLRECCHLDIKMSDALPKSICPICVKNLNSYHNFYRKVKEAQETLNALFLTPSTHTDSEKSKESKAQSNSSEIKKISAACQELIEEPFKRIEKENYVLGQTKDIINEVQSCRKATKIRQAKNDVVQEMYILELSKKRLVCESSNESDENEVESIEEELENKDGDIGGWEFLVQQQQEKLTQDYQILDERNAKNSLDVSNDYLRSIKDLKQIDDNEISLSIEYLEYYKDDEEEENYADTNSDVAHSFANSSVAAHMEINSWKDYKFLCFICDNIYSTFTDLKRHISQEHNIEKSNFQYKCYDCKKIIARYNFFLNHIRSKHHHGLKLMCDVCDLSFHNYHELSHHRNANCATAVNRAYTVACDKCFKSFHNISNLKNHVKYQHKSPKNRVKYKCTQCQKEFRYKSCLKSHKQLHADIKKFSCNYCDRSFTSKYGLERHLYVHVNAKTYQCNVCSKSYKTYQSLDDHQKLHTDNKTFKCQFCEKRFIQKIQKLTHERSHTGEMPYPCEQCDKRFRHRSALFAHGKVHSGCKPYSCEFCSKTFADSSNRNKHVRRMHLHCKSQ